MNSAFLGAQNFDPDEEESYEKITKDVFSPKHYEDQLALATFFILKGVLSSELEQIRQNGDFRYQSIKYTQKQVKHCRHQNTCWSV